MRTLVTGGAGFIGSHLCEALCARGHEVRALDDLSTGHRDHLRALAGESRFRFIEGTATDRDLVAALVDEVDAIFHLAAVVGVKAVLARPAWTIETNLRATETVLAAAARRGCPVFVASSSEVYGKSAQLPFREDADLTLGPTTTARWAYACAKANDEFLALGHWEERRLPVVVGRLFNTAGPRQSGRHGMVLPSFVAQALRGDPITVYGDGSQRRCFTHVADVVRAIVTLVEMPAAYGRVFNIGSDEEISMRALAEQVRDAAGSSSAVTLVPYAEAYARGFEDVARRVPDTTRLRTLTGWRPERGLADIVVDAVASVREALREPSERFAVCP
jgi:UDP-glucose 4-epimerase